MVATSEQAYLAGVTLSPREIHLHLNIAGRNIDNANDLVRQVAALFCREDLAEYEPTHTPGKALSAILQSATDVQWKWGFGVVEYVFLAPRPFYHRTTETTVSGTDSVTINPLGSVPCRPIITHTMAADASALTIAADNTTIMRIRNPLGTDLQAGQVIAVDFASRLVEIGGTPAMTFVDYTASVWHPNITGQTTITLSDAGNTTVRWKDEWM